VDLIGKNRPSGEKLKQTSFTKLADNADLSG
jgi:hypothetical protein